MRLRHIALVACDLEASCETLAKILSIKVAHLDPAVQVVDPAATDAAAVLAEARARRLPHDDISITICGTVCNLVG
ncbi:MAG: hypothetical protein QF726_01585 [Alphaproteobacteria bacterium]|jgi:molybdopterin/thiamine biosynthesis adenylyltransferase|nr:hypothetical protein [Alphaproteobacteria bacterium]